MNPDDTGRGGSAATGGSKSSGGASGTGGVSGTGGSNSGGSASTGGSVGTGGVSATGGSAAGGAPSGGGGAAAGGSGGAGASPDAPVDLPGTSVDTGGGAGDAFGAEGDHLPGRPDLKICRKEWTPAQCCEFLCSCLTNICSDSAKGKPGLATCMSWCPKLGDMARRCHVYHCFVSISPTGGIKDHDSHCGHAADQVQGGSCPVEAYK